jgi:hypothetical protein
VKSVRKETRLNRVCSHRGISNVPRMYNANIEYESKSKQSNVHEYVLPCAYVVFSWTVLAGKWPGKEHSCRKWKRIECFDKIPT